MNPYQIEVTCALCGEPGFGHVHTSPWTHSYQCSDPQRCAANIEANNAATAKHVAEIEAKLKETRETLEKVREETVAEGAGI